jgi:hypothetical protein
VLHHEVTSLHHHEVIAIIVFENQILQGAEKKRVFGTVLAFIFKCFLKIFLA